MNPYPKTPYMGKYGIPLLTPQTTNSTLPANLPNQIVTDSHLGFARGNLFDNLYKPYIAAEPFPVKTANEREALLNKVREYDFATVELNLYLDNFPHDKEKLALFNAYREQLDRVTKEYESRYGPLTLEGDILNAYPWSWLVRPWPWEVD
jgi:spore coat protein JB